MRCAKKGDSHNAKDERKDSEASKEKHIARSLAKDFVQFAPTIDTHHLAPSKKMWEQIKQDERCRQKAIESESGKT